MNIKEDYKVTKWMDWDMTLNISYTEEKSKYNFLDLINFSNPYTGMFPYAMLKNEDGSWADWSVYSMYQPYRDKIESELGISTVYNPVEDFNSTFQKTKYTRVRANTGVKINLWKGIGYELRFQYLRNSSNYEEYIPQDTWYIRNARINAATSDGEQILPGTGGDFTAENTFTSDWTVRNQLTYDGSFDNRNHQITALAGAEYRENKTNGYMSFQRGYDYQTMTATSYDITAASDFYSNYFGDYMYGKADKSSQTEYKMRYISYYGNLAYTAFKKYTINGSIRIDQSNLFGTDVNSQYKPIGSLGVSYKLSDENFMKSIDWLNNLTVRASYGLSGNSPLPTMGGPYDIIRVYKGGANFAYNNGYALSSPSNTKICWEKTKTYNIGIDFAVLNNRLNGSIDAYNKKTTDMLSNKPLNVLTGFQSIYANVGSLKNEGIEISLNSLNINTKAFQWTTNLNLSYNKNKVLSYYKEPTTSALMYMLNGAYTEGYPAGALFALEWAGLRHEDGVPLVYDKDGNKQYNFNKLTVDDVHYIGTTVPKWSGAFTNLVAYKGFELKAMFIFNWGHKMDVSYYLMLSGRYNYNRDKNLDNRWRQPGDEEFTNIPSSFEDPYYQGRATYYSASVYACSDINYQSAAYAKLRELTLSYSLPQNVCRALWLQSAKIRLTGYNVFKIVANDKGIDPEVGLGGDNYGAYYSVGLSINF